MTSKSIEVQGILIDVLSIIKITSLFSVIDSFSVRPGKGRIDLNTKAVSGL